MIKYLETHTLLLASIRPLVLTQGHMLAILSLSTLNGMLNLLTPTESLGSSTYLSVDCCLAIIELERTSTALNSALQLDFGLFVLFKRYCPNETSDAHLLYKTIICSWRGVGVDSSKSTSEKLSLQEI